MAEPTHRGCHNTKPAQTWSQRWLKLHAWLKKDQCKQSRGRVEALCWPYPLNARGTTFKLYRQQRGFARHPCQALWPKFCSTWLLALCSTQCGGVLLVRYKAQADITIHLRRNEALFVMSLQRGMGGRVGVMEREAKRV